MLDLQFYYPIPMRTTLTLEDHLVRALKQKAAEKNVPFKVMVHQALQLGLQSMNTVDGPHTGYVTEPRSLKPRTGTDLDRLGQIADEIEDESTIRDHYDPS